MISMFAKTRKSRKGFTLVELMVVVAIIGVLSAIAVPVYNDMTEKAGEAACEANRRIIDSAVMMWQLDQDPISAGVPAGGLADLSAYFQSTPVCPLGGDYTLAATGTTCDH